MADALRWLADLFDAHPFLEGTVIVVGVQLFGWIVWHQYRRGSV
jgi:hypothetical protein